MYIKDKALTGEKWYQNDLIYDLQTFRLTY